MALLKIVLTSILSGIIFFAVLWLLGENNEPFNAAVLALIFTVLVTVQSVRIYRRNNIK